MKRRTIPNKTRRTIAYVRVSTEDQANMGVSLAAQTARIAAYGTAMGFDASEVIRDPGASAKGLKRPGMAALLSAVRAAVNMDRAGASYREIATMLQQRAR